jgi:hypothetical protein
VQTDGATFFHTVPPAGYLLSRSCQKERGLGALGFPVSLSHGVDKAESYEVVYKEGGSG